MCVTVKEVQRCLLHPFLKTDLKYRKTDSENEFFDPKLVENVIHQSYTKMN